MLIAACQCHLICMELRLRSLLWPLGVLLWIFLFPSRVLPGGEAARGGTCGGPCEGCAVGVEVGAEGPLAAWE